MAQQQRRSEPWRNAERYYCEVCNAWMGGDRQSILIHENGKKHRENVEANQKQKRLDKIAEEKTQKTLQESLKKIEQAAALSHAKDVASGSFHNSSILPPIMAPRTYFPSQQLQQGPNTNIHQEKTTKSISQQEKESWQARKKKRENDKEEQNEQTSEPVSKKKKRIIGEDEGYYKIEETTYLEGIIFGTLLEEDMPVQIWTGSQLANMAEKALPEKHHFWKNGIVVRIRRLPLVSDKDNDDDTTLNITADIAYLLATSDTEETIEKSVKLDRIRLALGSDESIPDTLEEARIAATGGQTVVVEDNENVEIDENTGLSTWGAVSITQTTARSELKEERARLRAKRRAEAEEAQRMKKEAEGRKMEEAKVANADDSALGAYDVWSSGKSGYKGVDIHKEVKLDVNDTAKSLSKGKGPVGFKKKSGSFFKKAKRKQNRRTTTAGDEED